jgi:6-pyruvoyltetrahydropterin/6-carboxytetrahydropterin synthase
MYWISTDVEFAAGHQVRFPDGTAEPLHGHNYRARVHLRAEALDETGYVVDFADLKKAAREVAKGFDHVHLNDTPPFDQVGRVNPTAENIARILFQEIGRRVNSARVRVARVEVWETDVNRAEYTEP